MANKFFGAIGLIGGTVGFLDAITVSVISDADAACVVDHDNEKLYWYTYDSGSAAAESSPDIIKPDDNGGNGRWLLTQDQSANWTDIRTFMAATSLGAALDAIGVKYETYWLPAMAWVPTATNGATYTEGEFPVNDINTGMLNFEGGAQDQYAEIDIVMPPTWDRGTVKFKFYWRPTAGCDAADVVTWGIQGGSYDDDDPIDAALGATVWINDTVTAGVEGDLHITGATAACTIAGAPGLGDMIHLKVYRDADASEGGDNMPEDARLFGVLMEFANTNKAIAW